MGKTKADLIDELKRTFRRIYYNLPLYERKSVIAFYKDEPVSWRFIYRRLDFPKNKKVDDITNKLLMTLREMEII